MHKHITSFVLLAVATVAACSPAAPAPPEGQSESPVKAPAKGEAPAAGKGDSTADASAGKGTPGGKVGDTDGGLDPETPDAACSNACQGLAGRCGDLGFCDAYCTDAPDVITCMIAKSTCTKADFIACEDAQTGGKGGGK